MVEHAIRRFSVSDVTFKPTYIRRPSTLRENLTSREVTVRTTDTASSNLSQGRDRCGPRKPNTYHYSMDSGDSENIYGDPRLKSKFHSKFVLLCPL